MEYFVVLEGKAQGPYSLDELRNLSVKPETFIKKTGMPDYKEAHEMEEIRALFNFRFRPTAPQYFASFDQRLLASVIDYFLISLFYVLFLLLLFIFIEQPAQRISTGLLLLPLIPFIKFIYSSFAEASAYQGTIGKRLLSIRVSDLKGQPIPISRSFGRNLAKIVSVLPLFFGYLYSFLNRKQQCFHDVLNDTLVIKQRLL